MSKESSTFRLSYESDGVIGKKTAKKPSSAKEQKSKEDFFNTTQASE